MSKEPFDLDDLDAFLSSEHSPEHCMQLSDLDGFLTAIAVGPEAIPPTEWLPLVWGGSEPGFRNAREAKKIVAAIMARYDEIVAGLQRTPPAVSPVFWVMDGYPIVSDWAEGFLDGVRLRLPEWSRLIGTSDNAILIPLAVYWVDDDDRPIISVDDEVRERIDVEASELIPEAVIAIHRYWRAQPLRSDAVTRLH